MKRPSGAGHLAGHRGKPRGVGLASPEPTFDTTLPRRRVSGARRAGPLPPGIPARRAIPQRERATPSASLLARPAWPAPLRNLTRAERPEHCGGEGAGAASKVPRALAVPTRSWPWQHAWRLRGQQKSEPRFRVRYDTNLAPGSGTDPELFWPSKSRCESIAARNAGPARSDTTFRGKSCRRGAVSPMTSRLHEPTPCGSLESGRVRWRSVASRGLTWQCGSGSHARGLRRF